MVWREPFSEHTSSQALAAVIDAVDSIYLLDSEKQLLH
jgi:hypothetical protein